MKQEEIIKGFVQLGVLMTALGKNEEWSSYDIGVTKEEYEQLQVVVNRQMAYNGWFTKDSVRSSLMALGLSMNQDALTNWAKNYTYSDSPENVAVIMAGNIPLVGFHDFLCVLISGNNIVAKLSSDDKTLLPALGEVLIQLVPGLKQRIKFTTGQIGEVDAVIATGSDNSMKYFEQYFGKYPHIFRKNRTSVAILTGDESKEELSELGKDIFSYFGLGCRNVSHLLLPMRYELSQFFEGIFDYSDVINHNKYGNNYDYNKAVYLMNKHELFDNNFVLLRNSEDLHSPLAMLHYHFYESKSDIDAYLKNHEEQIQAVVGNGYIPFGEAQSPALDDYADGVDVMQWLGELGK